MSITINGVNCEEIVKGLEERIDYENGPAATKEYLCDWGNRYALANGFLGLVTGTRRGVQFTPPTPYPESRNLWARAVRVRGVGRPVQGARQLSYDYAIVAVEFGVSHGTLSPQDDPAGLQSLDPGTPLLYATQEIDYGGEWVTVPNKSVKLANGHALTNDYGFFVAHAVMSVTFHRVPYLPADLILATLAAPLNSAKFLNCAAGKVRFDGARTHRTCAVDGTLTQDVGYTFAYRPIAPWDSSWDPNGTSGWQQVQDQSSNPIVARSDLNLLIPSGYGY